MATRDLTGHFRDLRARASSRNASYGGGRSGANDSLASGDQLSADRWDEARHTLPPLWVDNLDRVHEHISEIKAKMDKLKKAHTDRLLVTFDSNEDQHDMQIELSQYAPLIQATKPAAASEQCPDRLTPCLLGIASSHWETSSAMARARNRFNTWYRRWTPLVQHKRFQRIAWTR